METPCRSAVRTSLSRPSLPSRTTRRHHPPGALAPRASGTPGPPRMHRHRNHEVLSPNPSSYAARWPVWTSWTGTVPGRRRGGNVPRPHRGDGPQGPGRPPPLRGNSEHGGGESSGSSAWSSSPRSPWWASSDGRSPHGRERSITRRPGPPTSDGESDGPPDGSAAYREPRPPEAGLLRRPPPPGSCGDPPPRAREPDPSGRERAP